MAKVIITMKIMPDSPERDLKAIEEKVKSHITEYGGEIGKISLQPVAFGLKSLEIVFVSEESLGSTDLLEQKISEIEGVNSAEVADVRRAIG